MLRLLSRSAEPALTSVCVCPAVVLCGLCGCCRHSQLLESLDICPGDRWGHTLRLAAAS
jgi:hypothetical protein